MKLTIPEKEVGRRFRDQAQADLLATFETAPPTYTVPNFIALYRHNCPARNGLSTALELKEMYRASEADPEWGVPAARFGFIWREGRCRSCGQTARSRAGRLVDAHQRPPISGRAIR